MKARQGSEVWQPPDQCFVVVYCILPKRISQSSIARSRQLPSVELQR